MECHGSIHHLQCLEGSTSDIWPADDFEPEVDMTRCRLLNEPPRYPACGSIARPNILMFGDLAWMDRLARAHQNRLYKWLAAVRRLVIIEICAGSDIPTIRHFGEFQSGFQIRINPRDAGLTEGRNGVGLEMGGLEALSRIHAALESL